jgi:DNA-binding GntR family transcriptional regulator
MVDMAASAWKGAPAKRVVAQSLREAIVSGDMSPGQRLVELELASVYRATRGSVRAAMDELVAEGLIERIPNRGARVRVVPMDEAVAILECRSVLEGLIAAKAAERLTRAEVDELRRIGRQMQRAVVSGDVLTYGDLDARLHALLGRISHQQTAAQLVSRLGSQTMPHQFRVSLRPGRPQASLRQHLELISAVTDGDPQRAEAVARAHIDNVIAALREGAIGA